MFDLTFRHVLLGTYLLLLGGGIYLTYVQQERTISALEEKIEAHREPSSSLPNLKKRRNALEKRIENLRNERQTRYKRIPEQVSSPQVLRYLTNVAGTSFDTFDLRTVGRQSEDGYKVYTVKAEGRTSFSRLYHFVWTLENHRPFYRIENLQLSLFNERTTDRTTGRPEMNMLVAFKMDVNAIYGTAGADEQVMEERSQDGETLPTVRTDPHPPVPAHVLPPSRVGVNPFYPIIFDQIPPNTHGRLNVERAKFLSIIDEEAVFQTDTGVKRVGEGDRVYLGRIIQVDPVDGRVVARLNKGGIVGTVERTLDEAGPTSDRQDPQ